MLADHPVAASRHFIHRMNVIMRFLKKESQFFFGAQLSDYTYRVEFQQRGSPHIHALLWLDGVPSYNSDDGINFIDRNISCSLDVPYKDLVLKYQNHSHRETCFKKGPSCRFSFPRSPCERTRILDEDEIQNNSGRFLEFRRKAYEAMINSYHPKLMRLFRCNMDITLVTSTCAIAYYVGKYMSKAEPMMLKQDTRDAIAAAKSDTRGSYYERARRIANAVMSRREVSAQECSFRLCGLPYRDSSRASVYIPACRPENRIRLIKKDQFLDGKISAGLNIIDRYMNRPASLRRICLYEFASWFRPKPRRGGEQDDIDPVDQAEDVVPDVDEITGRISLQNNKGVMLRRRRHAVVSYPRFNSVNNSEDYLYCMILLYYPFDREEQILERFDSIEAAFNGLKDHFRTHSDDPVINIGLREQVEAMMLQLANSEIPSGEAVMKITNC